MASCSSNDINIKEPVYFRCPICLENLQEHKVKEKKTVNILCGHVYHQLCWEKCCKERRKTATQKNKIPEYKCLLCNQIKHFDTAKEIFLDAHVDFDYVRVQNSNKRLRLDISIVKQDLEEAKIKIHVLKNETELLRQTLENFRWEDVSQSFKDELMLKLTSSCSSLKIECREITFLKSDTLFELIRPDSDNNLVILKFTEDLYDHQSSLQGANSLDDFKHFFNFEILDCLKVACSIPSLDLCQLPVSPRILHMLLTTNQQSLKEDKRIIMKILHSFVCVEFGRYSSQLLNFTLVNLIVSQIQFEIDIPIPLVNETLLSYFKTCGILDSKNGAYVYRHDSVRFFTIGLLISVVRKNLDMSLTDACSYICEGRSGLHTLDDYCIGSLNSADDFVNDTLELDTQEITKAYKFNDDDHIDLFLILSILNVNGAKLLNDVFWKLKKKYTMAKRSIWDIRVSCKVDLCTIVLRIPEFAAIRGEYDTMKNVYDLFSSKKRSKYFEISRLVQLCCNLTQSQTEPEIIMRDRTISFILSLTECNNQLIRDKSKSTCLTVNLSLLKTVAEKGLAYFLHIWDVEHIFTVVFPNITEDEAAKLAFALIDPPKMMELLDLYNYYRPITI